MKYILMFFVSVLLFSCQKKTYVWNDKPDTERKFDRKLAGYTRKSIRDNPQMVALFSDSRVE